MAALDCLAHKAESIYSLALDRNSCLTPALYQCEFLVKGSSTLIRGTEVVRCAGSKRVLVKVASFLALGSSDPTTRPASGL